MPARGDDDPGDIAVAAGLASRQADGSVIFAPPPDRPAAPAPATHAPATRAPVTQASVQRQDTAAPAPPPAPPAAAPLAAPPAAASSAIAPGAATPDPAALADLVYERIERRLRTELLLERERRGALIDR